MNASAYAGLDVRVLEVGARDGLQNQPQILPVATRAAFIELLADAGLRRIEAASFVSPKWVPQMADSIGVMRSLKKRAAVSYSGLVPNLKGLEQAIEAQCADITVLSAASEAFCKANLNCTIAESLERSAEIVKQALPLGIKVRGSVSTVLGCPFTGAVAPADVAKVAAAFYDMGCYEVSLADTIGTGTPEATKRMIEACTTHVPVHALGGHFHDTYGMAIANVYAALESGIRVFDSSVSGLGGCPYSPGATGNVATEDLVFLLEGLGMRSGIDLGALMAASEFIDDVLDRNTESRVARATKAKQQKRATLSD